MKTHFFLTIFLFASMFLFTACSDNDCEPMNIPDCMCPAVYIPVCGCDDVTYGNSCEAECNNITDYTEGECN